MDCIVLKIHIFAIFVHIISLFLWSVIVLVNTWLYLIWAYPARNNNSKIFETCKINICEYGSWAIIFRRLFSKRCTLWSKSGTKSLVYRYQAKFAKIVPEHLKVCHIWLIQFKKQLMFSYTFYSYNSIVSF
jgi:hypothetical protein